MARKAIKYTACDSSAVLHSNWGNPDTKQSANGADFSTLYFNFLTGSQGALAEVDSRQLKCDSFNNSFFSAVSPDYELKYSEGTPFVDVTMTDFGNATVVAAGESLGSGTWYSYPANGAPALTDNFVFYMVVDGNTYAFENLFTIFFGDSNFCAKAT